MVHANRTGSKCANGKLCKKSTQKFCDEYNKEAIRLALVQHTYIYLLCQMNFLENTMSNELFASHKFSQLILLIQLHLTAFHLQKVLESKHCERLIQPCGQEMKCFPPPKKHHTIGNFAAVDEEPINKQNCRLCQWFCAGHLLRKQCL